MGLVIRGILFFVIITNLSYAQLSQQKDSLSLNKKRLIIISSTEIVSYSASMYALSSSWYSDYEKSSFHWFDDSDEWLQMDKAGHLFTAYHLSGALSRGFKYSGISNSKSDLLGAGISFVLVSSIDIFDGYSEKWGASFSDISANFVGSGLYSLQKLISKTDVFNIKYSFHPTKFSDLRPALLGDALHEQAFKDYNGQTYWLSVNVSELLNNEKIPSFISFSFGYGAEGMTGGKENPKVINGLVSLDYDRYRQYYFSLDIDFTKIETDKKFLRKLFRLINVIKLPFPAIEYGNKNLKFRALYF